jgi:hypothetical protein
MIALEKKKSSCPIIILSNNHPAPKSSCPIIILPQNHPAPKSSCPKIILSQKSSCPKNHPVPKIILSQKSSCPIIILPNNHPAPSFSANSGGGDFACSAVQIKEVCMKRLLVSCPRA